MPDVAMPSIEDIIKGVKDTISAEVKSAVESLRKEAPDTAEKKAAITDIKEPIPPHLKGGGFFQMVAKSATDSSSRSKLIEGMSAINKAASGNNTLIDSEGGFLVSSEMAAEIATHTYEAGLLPSRVDRMAIGEGKNSFTWNELDDYNRATSGSVGGFRAYRVNEGTAVTYNKGKVRQNEIKLQKMMVSLPVTSETLEDATALEGLIMRTAPMAFADKLDDEIIGGTGGMQCLGLLGSPSLVTVAKESGQGAATIVMDNISKMWARMPAGLLGGAEWYINQDCYPQLFTLSQVVGTGGVPVWLPPGGLSQSPFGTLFGRPVVPVPACSTVGTVGDIIFANLKEYLVIDKGGIKNDVSMHVLFLTDEQVFRFVYRINGQPKWSNTITPKNGTNTLSPYIALATRS